MNLASCQSPAQDLYWALWAPLASPPRLTLPAHSGFTEQQTFLFFLGFCTSASFPEKGEGKHIYVLPWLQNLAFQRQISSLCVLLGQLWWNEGQRMCLSSSAFECSMREAFKWHQEVGCDLLKQLQKTSLDGHNSSADNYLCHSQSCQKLHKGFCFCTKSAGLF